MSASTELVVPLATLILGGGLTGSLVSLYAAKRKVPVERDAIAVSGAETAVLALERSLAAETRRADRADAEVIRLQGVVEARDARIAALEKRLDEVQESLDGVRAELHQIITENAEARQEQPPTAG